MVQDGIAQWSEYVLLAQHHKKGAGYCVGRFFRRGAKAKPEIWASLDFHAADGSGLTHWMPLPPLP